MTTFTPDKYEGRDKSYEAPPPIAAESADMPLHDVAGEVLDAVDDNLQESHVAGDDASDQALEA